MPTSRNGTQPVDLGLMRVVEYLASKMGCLCRLDIAPNLAETHRLVANHEPVEWSSAFFTSDRLLLTADGR
jgi:hypothetical protein